MLCTLLVTAYAAAYTISLEGAGDEMGNDLFTSRAFTRAPKALLWSVGAATAAAWLAALLPWWGCRAVLGALLLMSLGFLAWSHDTTYKDHG